MRTGRLGQNLAGFAKFAGLAIGMEIPDAGMAALTNSGRHA
ncbi:MAG: hypothetical protein ACRYGK_08760 [Janthinobacterium lividum]